MIGHCEGDMTGGCWLGQESAARQHGGPSLLLVPKLAYIYASDST